MTTQTVYSSWIEHFKNEIIEMYTEKGMSLREIAAEYGVSHTTINKWLSRWEIQRDRSVYRGSRVRNLRHKKFGHLIVIAQAKNFYPTHWLCLCTACGKETVIRADRLPRRSSCGCQKEK